MISILFKKEGHFIMFQVENRKVNAAINGIMLPYYPMDLKKVETTIVNSRNKIPFSMLSLFVISKQEMDDFEKAEDDFAIKDNLIADARKNGAELIDMTIKGDVK